MSGDYRKSRSKFSGLLSALDSRLDRLRKDYYEPELSCFNTGPSEKRRLKALADAAAGEGGANEVMLLAPGDEVMHLDETLEPEEVNRQWIIVQRCVISV